MRATAVDLEFPASRKRAGNLHFFRPSWRFTTLIHAVIPWPCTQIPYRLEQGMFCLRAGNRSARNREKQGFSSAGKTKYARMAGGIEACKTIAQECDYLMAEAQKLVAASVVTPPNIPALQKAIRPALCGIAEDFRPRHFAVLLVRRGDTICLPRPRPGNTRRSSGRQRQARRGR